MIIISIQLRALRSTGDAIWVLHKAKILAREADGKALQMISLLINITARKEYEEKILKISYYDSNTGLRTVFTWKSSLANWN